VISCGFDKVGGRSSLTAIILPHFPLRQCLLLLRVAFSMLTVSHLLGSEGTPSLLGQLFSFCNHWLCDGLAELAWESSRIQLELESFSPWPKCVSKQVERGFQHALLSELYGSPNAQGGDALRADAVRCGH
jgi:hypothetical protein